jgi:hypothetical protein
MALLYAELQAYTPASREGSQMDSKVYLEWRAKLGKWVVEYHGQVQAQFDTKAQ